MTPTANEGCETDGTAFRYRFRPRHGLPVRWIF